MKTNNLLILVMALTLALALSTGNAHALTLWQFGLEDQGWTEFKTVEGGAYQPVSVIDFGDVSGKNPSMRSGSDSPGVLYTQNPYPQYNWVTTAATRELKFEFNLDTDYSQLDLFYGRFGEEVDYISFDGVQLFSANGTAEGQWDLFEFAITGEILAGRHSLTLAYGGGGVDNGHYIDFVRLENGKPLDNSDNGNQIPVPEPGTFFLIGTGIAGLFGCRRKLSRL